MGNVQLDLTKVAELLGQNQLTILYLQQQLQEALASIAKLEKVVASQEE